MKKIKNIDEYDKDLIKESFSPQDSFKLIMDRREIDFSVSKFNHLYLDPSRFKSYDKEKDFRHLDPIGLIKRDYYFEFDHSYDTLELNYKYDFDTSGVGIIGFNIIPIDAVFSTNVLVYNKKSEDPIHTEGLVIRVKDFPNFELENQEFPMIPSYLQIFADGESETENWIEPKNWKWKVSVGDS